VDGDENKAYLAMGARGLKVLGLRSRNLGIRGHYDYCIPVRHSDGSFRG